MPNCDTEGVIAAITGVIGSVEACEALKLLVGGTPRKTLLCVDLWEGDFRDVGIAREPNCPACVRAEYEFLSGAQESWTTVLCGRNTVQIVPPTEQRLSLEALGRRLGRIGKASYNGFVLTFEVADRELVVFPTGRTLVRGTSDEAEARGLFARYVGT
jgi:adenylyltransferase/sulfurtransferase